MIAMALNAMDRTVMYVYCSNALNSHSIPSALKIIVELMMIKSNRSFRNFGTTMTATANAA